MLSHRTVAIDSLIAIAIAIAVGAVAAVLARTPLTAITVTGALFTAFACGVAIGGGLRRVGDCFVAIGFDVRVGFCKA